MTTTDPPPRTWPDSITLGEARAWLRTQAAGDGAPCPCCTQFTRIYQRGITSAMALALITAWRTAGMGEWHMPTVAGGASGDTAKLVYWGLIQQVPGAREDGSPRHGWWHLTDRGRDWVLGRIGVPRYAVVYAGRLLGLDRDGPQYWYVTDALGKKFNYSELMADRAAQTEDEVVF